MTTTATRDSFDCDDPQHHEAQEMPLPFPPDSLSAGEIRLHLDKIVPADRDRGLVPFYHFKICRGDSTEVGHINFRIGDTEHILNSAGHIGYGVLEPFRGHGYALQACHAIAPFVRSIYRSVIITCDPDNFPSIKTIERLGVTFLNEVAVPPHDPSYQSGARRKRRYEWTP